mmetsp:Transcript_36854/g.68661  ORF Transcript_36854/g.68661 Transcript_36854/m.68661 type:complete len:94 (-) Transcript_36854:1700-1981(-)
MTQKDNGGGQTSPGDWLSVCRPFQTADLVILTSRSLYRAGFIAIRNQGMDLVIEKLPRRFGGLKELVRPLPTPLKLPVVEVRSLFIWRLLRLG